MRISITWTQTGSVCSLQIVISRTQRRRVGRPLEALLRNSLGIVTRTPHSILVEHLNFDVSLALAARLESLLGARARRTFGGPLPSAPSRSALEQLRRRRQPSIGRGARRRRNGLSWAALRAGAGSGIVPGPAHQDMWLGFRGRCE